MKRTPIILCILQRKAIATKMTNLRWTADEPCHTCLTSSHQHHLVPVSLNSSTGSCYTFCPIYLDRVTVRIDGNFFEGQFCSKWKAWKEIHTVQNKLDPFTHRDTFLAEQYGGIGLVVANITGVNYSLLTWKLQVVGNCTEKIISTDHIFSLFFSSFIIIFRFHVVFHR